MALMTDPLAANLFVIGIMFIGFAGYVLYRFIMKKQNTEVDSGFGIFLIGTGVYAAFYGLIYSVLWPAPMGGSYSILFGDPLALLGIVSILTGVIVLKKASLAFGGIFAFFAGIYAVVSGYGGYVLGMTKSPIALLLMYLGAGIGGIFVAPMVSTKNKTVVTVTAILVVIAFVGAALIALYTGYSAVGEHLAAFKKAVG